MSYAHHSDDLWLVEGKLSSLQKRVKIWNDTSERTLELIALLIEFLGRPPSNVGRILSLLIDDDKDPTEPNLLVATIRIACEANKAETAKDVHSILEECAELPGFGDPSYVTSVERGYIDNLNFVCDKLYDYGIKYEF